MEPRSKYDPGSISFSGSEDWRNQSNLNAMSISELFSKLRDTFRRSDFDIVEETLVSREAMWMVEIEDKKRELELSEERMKFEKLERIQEEMNKVLMKNGNEKGDSVGAKNRVVGDGVASHVAEMGMNEVLMESCNVETWGLE
ncbi:hypothetical protein TSUD_128900 [Trifolium subterraneum]|uniref:Uncharacterized protein n=1 Tax=Trifolium subterraneum TaxID=3900 RepID=A0A2Z6N920_TRISU|nr:hypothetical protein TSUD_128900 [Trifolium subterraneum]